MSRETKSQRPAVFASEIPPRARPSAYPAPFAKLVAGREKRPLGNHFGLTNFGVNLVRMAPGSITALRHAHTRQDELLYILEGSPTLVTNSGTQELRPGMVVGFPAGTGDAHHLANHSSEPVVLLEVGDRTPGDEVHYPDDDLQAVLGPDGTWQFLHKDGSPYDQ